MHSTQRTPRGAIAMRKKFRYFQRVAEADDRAVSPPGSSNTSIGVSHRDVPEHSARTGPFGGQAHLRSAYSCSSRLRLAGDCCASSGR